MAHHRQRRIGIVAVTIPQLVQRIFVGIRHQFVLRAAFGFQVFLFLFGIVTPGQQTDVALVFSREIKLRRCRIEQALGLLVFSLTRCEEDHPEMIIDYIKRHLPTACSSGPAAG